MNLKNIIYLYAFILIADLNAEVNISNQVDNDHRTMILNIYTILFGVWNSTRRQTPLCSVDY